MNYLLLSVNDVYSEEPVSELKFQEQSTDEILTIVLRHEDYPFLAHWQDNDWENMAIFMDDIPMVTHFPLEKAFPMTLQMFEQSFREDGDKKTWRLIGKLFNSPYALVRVTPDGEIINSGTFSTEQHARDAVQPYLQNTEGTMYVMQVIDRFNAAEYKENTND